MRDTVGNIEVGRGGVVIGGGGGGFVKTGVRPKPRTPSGYGPDASLSCNIVLG